MQVGPSVPPMLLNFAGVSCIGMWMQKLFICNDDADAGGPDDRMLLLILIQMQTDRISTFDGTAKAQRWPNESPSSRFLSLEH